MKEIIYNSETGEKTERDLTADEIALANKIENEMREKIDVLEAKGVEKLTILEKLGLTEDEAKLLLS